MMASGSLDGSENDAEVRALIDGVLAFVEAEIVPLEAEYSSVLDDPRTMYGDDGRPVPAYGEARRRARVASAKAGFYSMFAPVEIGGGGLGLRTTFLVYEALYRVSGPGRALVGDVIGQWNRGPSGILDVLSAELRQSLAPRLLSGEEIFCFALSEPESGSDAWAMQTRADRVEGGWRINGMKQWISDAPYADHALLFAVTNADDREARKGGISAFMVPMGAPGVSTSSVIKLFGEPGGLRSILTFDDVFVPDESIVGVEGGGLKLATSGVSLGRIFNAGRAVGMSRWALKLAAEYANERKTFGHRLAEYQAIQLMLADSEIEAYAMYVMALDCAHKIDIGRASSKRLAMVKAFACDRSFEILDRCMQIHGGMGLVNETRLYAGWHQARISRVADGSSEIMRRNVARAMLKGDLSF